MDILPAQNENLVGIPDPIAPITNPEGERAPIDALAPGNAALSASAAATVAQQSVGLASNDGAKNLVFLAVVGFLIYKYGKGFFYA